jgi:hypothetical protein
MSFTHPESTEGGIHLYPAAVMTELEAAMWRHRPQDAARIEASLANPAQLVELTLTDLSVALARATPAAD